jgi:formylglycine-generating enzyme required for sulfatase activity
VSLWDRFIAWLNAEEPPPKTAEPPTSTLDPDTERYSQELEVKLDRTVQDLADGIINRAQFENLYRHYQNQRRMVQGLVVEGSDQVPAILADGESSSIIRKRYAAKVLAYAVYDNESSAPLHTRGNFPVDDDLVVGFLSGFRSAAAEIMGAGAAKAEAEDGKMLCFVPGQYSTLIVIYSSDPAEVDVRSLRQTHFHFETLNEGLLKQDPIPTGSLLFNYDMVLKVTRHEEPLQVAETLAQDTTRHPVEPEEEPLQMAETLAQDTTRHPVEPEMILIPASEFVVGSDSTIDKDAMDCEQPQCAVYLPDYYLAKTLVTDAQYAAFVRATGHRKPARWEGGKIPSGKEDHPVVDVSWYDAMSYCNWLSEGTDKPYRLPTEVEWEKGARGSDGRIYPWGHQWDASRCNSREGGPDDTTSVGAYPNGASPYGLLDMAGNVWEWTVSLWGKRLEKPEFKYPYDPRDGREDLNADANILRVARGGAFESSPKHVRCAYRLRYFPKHSNAFIGFRVCVAPRQD